VYDGSVAARSAPGFFLLPTAIISIMIIDIYSMHIIV
jgi:hypothetical protein